MRTPKRLRYASILGVRACGRQNSLTLCSQTTADSGVYGDLSLHQPGTENDIGTAMTVVANTGSTSAGYSSDAVKDSMQDAMSERSGREGANPRKHTRSHAEPESAPMTPYTELDPNNERFAKFQPEF